MTNTITIKRPHFTSYQKRIVESDKRFTVTEASTKSGKTFSHIFWLFEEAHKGQPGYEYWWVAPVYSQADIAFKRMARKVAESGAYIINLSKLTITTPVGTVITFKSADNPSTLYGENVYAFVFDEYSRAKEDAWFALRTTITYTHAKGKFIGNVVAKNWAWDLARKAESGSDPEFEYFKITAYDAIEAGILTLGEVEQAQKDLPARMFKMLYLADFSEVEGALWSYDLIDRNRVDTVPELRRIIVSVDPSGSGEKGSDEAGLIVVGLGIDGLAYVLEDLTGVYSPDEWARRAVHLYNKWKADRILAELNQGWDMVKSMINNIDSRITVQGVSAKRGKVLRAEPVVQLYEQNRVKHVGIIPKLEDEMTTWDAKLSTLSPGRIDALVYGVTELMLQSEQAMNFY
jgi:phage terminase large subunit-like protein